jgi:hypothetical protein
VLDRRVLTVELIHKSARLAIGADVKGACRIGGFNQAIIILGGQQHKLALAAPRNFDRAPERGLDDLAGSVAQIGERKRGHIRLLESVNHYPDNGYFS